MSAWCGLTMLALASIAVMAAGCSHETLGSGVADLNVMYKPSPAGVGRYERASFGVGVIHALPADPATAAVMGSNEILFRFDSFTADLTLNQDVAFTHIALSPGTYRVTKIEIGPPFLVDTNVSSTPATCIEGVASVASGPAASQVPASFTFVNPATLTFTVSPGQTRLEFKVDVPALIAGYESSFTCQDDCGGGTPCLTAFNQTTFRNALLAAVSFE
jgi:hypothetical protein